MSSTRRRRHANPTRAIRPSNATLVGVAVGGAALLAAWKLLGSGSAYLGWKGSPEIRPKVRSFNYPDTAEGRAAYVRMLVSALQANGLSREQAILFAAHVAREGGLRGSYVWNANFGNLKAWPARGSQIPAHPAFVLTDALGYTDFYRAYDSPADGLADAIAFIRDRAMFAGAWRKLMANDPTWYGTLGLEGYYEGEPDPMRPGVHTLHNATTIAPVQREYDGIVAYIRRALGTGAPASESSSLVLSLGAGAAAAAAAYYYRDKLAKFAA